MTKQSDSFDTQKSSKHNTRESVQLDQLGRSKKIKQNKKGITRIQ